MSKCPFPAAKYNARLSVRQRPALASIKVRTTFVCPEEDAT